MNCREEMKQLGMRGILCSPFEMSLSGLPLTFYGLKGPSDWHRSAPFRCCHVCCVSIFKLIHNKHGNIATAIYKSGVEYEQGMRKRPPSKFGVALVQEYRKRGLTQYSLAQKLRTAPADQITLGTTETNRVSNDPFACRRHRHGSGRTGERRRCPELGGSD